MHYVVISAPDSATQCFLRAPHVSQYDVGVGDFTVVGMFMSTTGGPIIARRDGTGEAGFQLSVGTDGSIQFHTYGASSISQATTGPTAVLDNCCHTVVGVRKNGVILIYVDGLSLPVTTSGAGLQTITSDVAVTLGALDHAVEPHRQFRGGLMNISFWNIALDGDALVRACFGRLTGAETGLLGFWPLSSSGKDLSPLHNDAQPVGPVSSAWCPECVWARGDNDFVFAQVANLPDPDAPSDPSTQSVSVLAPAGASALTMCILSNSDQPSFPAGATVRLTDPNGVVYDQDLNTDTVFVKTAGGQVFSANFITPTPGEWTVTVTAPGSTVYTCNIQTIPTQDVVQTSLAALDPLFSETAVVGSPYHGRLMRHYGDQVMVGGFWGWVVAVAVVAVVVVAVTAAVVYSGGAAAPTAARILAGVIVFGAVAIAAYLDTLNTQSVSGTTTQIAGSSGFIVATDPLILMDANAEADLVTQLIYRARMKRLFPSVVASEFNATLKQLVGPDMVRDKVKALLLGASSGLVSAAGHGKPSYLMGTNVAPGSTEMVIVLATYSVGQFTPPEAAGKIFHLFACECGTAGTATSPGLAQALVAAGAKAAFGYNQKVKMTEAIIDVVGYCGSQIDLTLMAGGTCAQAYQAAYKAYTDKAKLYVDNGKPDLAALLKWNRDALVGPSTNPIFGDPNAKLNIAPRPQPLIRR